MIGLSSRISGAFSNSSVVSLFQSGSVAQSNENGTFQASATISGTFASSASKAIDSIMKIVMDAQGNTDMTIKSDAAVMRASTGAGNDQININAARAYAVTSGAGNDTINITSTDGGHIGHGHHNGNLPAVMGVGAGDGSDTVNIDAKGTVMAVSGEAGNDTVNVKTDSLAFGVYGGTGNDTVNVNAHLAALVDGGDGNDVVNVTADSIFGVSGGKGNDVINLTNKGNEAAQVFFSQGDGKDIINSNGPVSINLFSADGTQKLDMKDATWKQDGNSVTISFGNTGDAITVNLTGDAANGAASVSYDQKTGNLIIGPAEAQSQSTSSVTVESSVTTTA